MSRHRPILFLLLIAASLAAAPGAEAQRGWDEIRSPHFTVYTDAGERTGRQVALRFEQMRAVFGIIFQQTRLQSEKPVIVVAFRDRRGMRSVARLYEGKPVDMVGYFQPGQGADYIVLDLSSQGRWQAVFHELAHLLMNANSSKTQLWFDEGFAEFFSTTEIAGNRFRLGAVPQSVHVLDRGRLMPVTELFAVTQDSPVYSAGRERHIFYAQSWLAVHYLWLDDSNRQRLVEYFRLWRQGETVESAIRKGFGVEPRDLDREMETHFRSGRTSILAGEMPPGIDRLSYQVRALDAVDARAVVADLRLHTVDHWEQALKEFEEIVHEHPSHALARRGLGYGLLRRGDLAAAAEHFQRAAELDSSDPRVHFFSATLLMRMGPQHSAEMRSRLRDSLLRAVELDPQYAEAHSWLGLAYSWESDFDSAIRHSRLAVQLSPRNEQFALNLAGFHLQKHDWDEARTLLRPLAESTDRAVAGAALLMLQSADSMEQALASGGAVVIAPRMPLRDQTGEPSLREDADDEEDEEEDVQDASLAGPAPLRYFSGTLVKVECSSANRAVFTVIGGNKVYVLSSRALHDVAWKSPEKFSCDWRNLKVQGFYRHADGASELVALQVDD